jgi:antitoxin component YwqK of YwqJK toxin-antitoxin module
MKTPIFSTPHVSPQPLRHGTWVEYNKHAVVIARGSYHDNQKHGLWREYYDTGELMLEEYYVHGIVHGRFATFHPNSQLCSEGMFVNGKRHGAFRVFDEGGEHVRTMVFAEDVMVEDEVVVRCLAIA